jgi:aminotransferase
MRLSDTVQSIPPSGIRRMFDIVSGMPDVISLGVGEPDFDTPWCIRETAIYSLEKGRTTYTSNQGIPELRRELVDNLDRRFGLRYDADEHLLITVGVSEALDLAFRSLLNPGDEVIVPEPCYVSYVPCVRFAGGIPVVLETRAEDRFLPRPEALEALIGPRTRAIMLNYPHNPTGTTMTRADLLPIADIVLRHNLVAISDEVYERLTYSGEHVPVATLPGMQERTLLLNGFSKAYAMTGWRIGFAAGPAPWISAMTKIHQYTALCASRMAQEAAVDALRYGESSIRTMVDDYAARRNVIVAGLNRLGLPCAMPQGAFYAFPSIEPTGLSSEEFAERLLREARVAVVPGNAFGKGGDNHVRCSYAYSIGQIEEALVRIGTFLENLSRPVSSPWSTTSAETELMSANTLATVRH